jgi:oligopeptide/dipeptide ABC transporter ATP-binding protein
MNGADRKPAGDRLLTARGLDVVYRTDGAAGRVLRAVRGVNLEIGRGEILAVVGESGCGKTSLARAILGLVPPSGGTLRFDDVDLLGPDRSRVQGQIQAVFQDPLASLSPRRTMLQSVREPLDHLRLGAAATRGDAAIRALETVGLDPQLATRYPHELSGGQRQRVALARAIAPRPALIVADEPLSSLDLGVQHRMVRLIRDLGQRMGIAFLFISHDLTVVRRLADRVGVMYLGRLVETGPTEALFSHPAHPYTQALLDAVPVADPDHAPPRVLEGEVASPLTPPSGCVFHTRCGSALPRCAEEAPAEREIEERTPGRTGHRTSCHLWNR